MSTTTCRKCSQNVSLDDSACPRCGCPHPADPFLDRIIRQNIRIQRLVGTGGMGNVYMGMETHLERPVAVKILHRLGPHSDRHAHYFLREARVLSRLRHPNIVSVLDFGKEADGTLFLVMEFIPGRTLEAIISQDAPLSPRRALRILIQITAGLEEAHRRNIIHRDLKPSNVILEEVAGLGDFAKVLDFGIAKSLRGEASQLQHHDGTEIGTAIGTPEYMSPEQAQGLQLDPRTDIYSLGLLFFELLTRSLPFKGENVLISLMKRTIEDPPPPSSITPTTPAELDAICLRALARNPTDRYPDVQHLRMDLQRALESLDAPRGAPLVAPRPEPETSGSVAILAILSVFNQDTPTGATTTARRQFEIASLLEELTRRYGGRTLVPAGALAFAAFELQDEGQHIHQAALAALDIRASASQRFPFARFQMGLAQGALRAEPERPPTGEAVMQASSLARGAAPSQILARSELAPSLRRLLTRPSGDALELLDLLAETSPPPAPRSIALPGDNAARALRYIGRLELRRALDADIVRATTQSRGGAIAIVGSAGSGRRHTALYAQRLARELGALTLHAVAHPDLIDRPFRPLLDLALQAAGFERYPFANNGPTDLNPHQFEAGLTLLGLRADQASFLAEQFFASSQHDPLTRLHTPIEQPLSFQLAHKAALHPLDPNRVRLIALALRALLTRISESGPALVILENLHLADSATLAVLPALVALTQDIPLLLLATADEQLPLPLPFRLLPLRPLQPGEAQSFIAELADLLQIEPPAGVHDLVQRSLGSPLYLARALEAPLPGPAPDSLQSLLSAQVTQLPNRLQRLLLITSIIGEYFETSLLEGLFPRSGALADALQSAADLGLIQRSHLDPELWCFRHASIHQAIYANVPARDRPQAHQRVVQALLNTHPPLTRSQRLLLARQAHLAHADANPWAERLGDVFSTAGAPQEASAWYKLATRPAEPHHLSLKLADALLRTRQPQDALLHLKPPPGDPELATTASAFEAHAALLLNDDPHAVRTLQSALRVAAPNAPVTARLLITQARLLARKNMHREAMQTLEACVRLLHRPQTTVPDDLLHLRWLAALLRGVAAINLGLDDEAERSFSTSLKAAISLDHASGVTFAIAALSSLWLPQRAELLLQRTTAALQSPHINLLPPHEATLLRLQGRAHHFLQDTHRAHDAWHRALDLAVELGDEQEASLTRRLLAGQATPEPFPNTICIL